MVYSRISPFGTVLNAPTGKYKLVIVDWFTGEDGVWQIYDDRNEAVENARIRTKDATYYCNDPSVGTIFYAYDDQGNYLGGNIYNYSERLLFKKWIERKAKKIATEVHKNQFRLDNITPYITHLENVVDHLKRIEIEDEDIICATWLHDSIEDTPTTIEYIKGEFTSKIARIVKQLTKDVDKEQYKERIKNADYDIQIIKLADILDNCSDLTAPYLSEDLVERKIEDCKSLYLPLAKKICLEFYWMLLDRIDGVNGFSKEDWLNGVYCKEKS